MKDSIKCRFKVARAKILTDDGNFIGRWLITDNLSPVYALNEWVDLKSMRKASTGKEYANKLVIYLNFLDMNSKSYKDATNDDVMAFIMYIIYGCSNDMKIRSLDGQVSYSTLSKYITVITEFYKWLDKKSGSRMEFDEKNHKRRAQKSFLYGQIYTYDYKYIIDRHILNLHGNKEYIKWYTKTEKESLCSSLLTLRDKAIFLITLQGFRIDEVLSMQLDDYDSNNNMIRPSRSKGRANAIRGSNNLRVVALPPATCEILDRYIFTERSDAENKSGILSQHIFINLKKSKHQGLPLQYRAYWEIFKKCAIRAGVDYTKIRTHSGRSTKVMEMLEHQALHPEDGLTDIIILEHFGWKSMDSIEHYRDHNNPIIAKAVYEKLHDRKAE